MTARLVNTLVNAEKNGLITLPVDLGFGEDISGGKKW